MPQKHQQPANVKSSLPDKPMSLEKSNTNPATKTLSSSELFGLAKQVFIQHNGEVYTLKITKSGKLLLVK